MDAKLTPIIEELKSHGSEKNRAGMARFGIETEKAFGVSMPLIRQIGKAHKNDHELALVLWDTGYHEARILAAVIDDPAKVTPQQMDRWMTGFNSWDLCDQSCTLFDKTAHAVPKIKEWVKLESEFQRRAGFALLASLAWHSKNEPDETFLELLPLIEAGSDDERNFVKKAVNWALREIGKRNKTLNKAALETAYRIKERGTKAARWIAADAIRELEDEQTRHRLLF